MAFNLRRSDFAKLPTAPPDPITQGARGERRVNYNSATGRRLFHQSHMPLGIHAGKIMERVPAAYLLEFFQNGYASMSTEQRQSWWPVWKYCEFNLDAIRLRKQTELVTQNLKPKLPREYTLRLRCNLVTLERANRSKSPADKCEICHDDEAAECACDHGLRVRRNQKRQS